jgi:hypothetical protein
MQVHRYEARLELVMEALEQGIKPTARKYERRYETQKKAGRVDGLTMAPERGQDLHVYDELLEGVQV